MTKNVLLLAAVTLLVPSLAVAGTVTYTTTGTFTSSGTSTSALMAVTFTGTTQTVNTPELSAVLGSFTHGSFDKCKSKGFCTTTDKFTLTITQGPGKGNLDATVTGLVAFNSKSGQITWVFDTLSVNINGVTYVGYPGNTAAGPTVYGGVSGSVPEPNAQLLLGLGSVGLMGLAFASRKMIGV